MHIQQLDYTLPETLIAQKPVEPREHCRLMVIHRKSGTWEHRKFLDFGRYVKQGDLLVLNTAKVVPARMYATCEELPDREFEVLVLDGFDKQECTALLNPSRRIRVGMILRGVETGESISVLKEVGDGQWKIRMEGLTWNSLLSREGHLALPPYILKMRESNSDLPEDREWYQTAYCDREGAIAAPTAGLHFSGKMLDDLQKDGVDLARIFLKVGLGTFQPIRTEEIDDYRLHTEEYEVDASAAAQIKKAHDSHSNLVAVGTTVTRTLESMMRTGGIRSCRGESDLFIKPPFDFKVVGGLLTNFHLPKTTLLALVYAFGGTELIRAAYEEAVREKYRFFSYGDAMLIL